MPEEAANEQGPGLDAPLNPTSETHVLTADELRPFFANMPATMGEMAHELALTRFRLAEARVINQQLLSRPRAARRAKPRPTTAKATKRTTPKGTRQKR